MPIYMNKSTGLVEATDKPGADHEVPLVDPKGQMGSAPMDQVQDLMGQGYRQPNHEELSGLLKEAHFNEPGEQAKTALEGLASGATFGLSTGVERAMGVAPDDINARAEANPGMHGMGEAAGVIGSSMLGLGEGAMLASAGKSIAGKIVGKSLMSKIVATASAGAIENALFQSGNEISKFMSSDPGQSAETAIANVGLSGLLGAGVGGTLGGIKAGFDGLMDAKTSQFIADFKGRLRERMNMPKAPEATTSETMYDPFTKQEIAKPATTETRTGTKQVYDPFTHQSTDKTIELGEPKVGMMLEQEPVEATDASSKGAKFADRIISKGMAKAMGLVTGAAVGHPFIGAYIGHELAPILEEVMPLLIKPLMALEPSGAGLAGALNYAKQVVKGENKLTSAVANVFGAGRDVLSEPSIKDLEKLQQHVDKVASDENRMMQIGQHVGHYLPDHAVSMSTIAGRSMQYLESVKPKQPQGQPLDSALPLSKQDITTYQNALKIAQSPLSVLDKVKTGSITGKDMQHLQGLYPNLYSKMQEKVLNSLMDHKSKNGSIPYKTKQGLSVFLGQPMDSSMLGNSIAINQATFMKSQAPQMPKLSGKAMKTPGLSQLPSQARSIFRSTGHR